MKYEFTGKVKVVGSLELRQIRALVAIAAIGVAVGDIGGWIESEKNLSQVSGDAWVSGNAQVYGDAQVQCRIVLASRSDGYDFIVTPTSKHDVRIIAGCRYFTFAEARQHWQTTRGSTSLGKESLAIIAHLENMAKIKGWIS